MIRTKQIISTNNADDLFLFELEKDILHVMNLGNECSICNILIRKTIIVLMF